MHSYFLLHPCHMVNSKDYICALCVLALPTIRHCTKARIFHCEHHPGKHWI